MKNLSLKKIILSFVLVLLTLFVVACDKTEVDPEKKIYNVVFETNGGSSIAYQRVYEGSLINKPANPSKEGVSFDGWYKTSSLSEAWIFESDKVVSDTTLYAKWDESLDLDYLDLTTRDASGENGMVASASAYASKAGLEILQQGGNAFDAAVAVGFALAVVEPNACGLGGGGLLVGYNSSKNEQVAFNYREFVPAAGTRARYLQGDISLSEGTVGAFGIPMMVDGMLKVYETQGSGNLTLAQVLSPAIELARYGFTVAPSLGDAIGSSFSKLKNTSPSDAQKIYTSDGIFPIKKGDTLINEDIANVIELISNEGRDGFYKGDVAMAIVNSIAVNGGIATMADMAYAINNTVVGKPISGTYKNYELVSMTPPSSGGITLVEMLNMLEYYDANVKPIKSLGHNSLEYIHLIGSIMQMSYQDRRRYIADTDFVKVPINGLTSKAYARERFLANYDPLVGRVISGYGDPYPYDNVIPQAYYTDETAGSHSTSHFSIIDGEGNIVSATNTINHFFGTGIIASGTGIVLNDVLTPLSTSSSSVNVVAPYKRSLANMSPSFMLKDGKSYMAVGSPGSNRISSAVLQTILNIIEFDMDVQTAINSARIFNYADSALEVEFYGDILQETIDGLILLGYKNLKVYGNRDLYFGGVQAIIIDQETGMLYGGADPRRDGKALGF